MRKVNLIFADFRGVRNKDTFDIADSSSTSSSLSTFAITKYVDRLKLDCNRSTTRRNYYSIWKIFNEFFIKLDVKPRSWEDRLILFVGYLVERNKKSQTVRSYVSAIKAVLEEDRIIISVDKFLLASLTKACKYRNDAIHTRLPIP